MGEGLLLKHQKCSGKVPPGANTSSGGGAAEATELSGWGALISHPTPNSVTLGGKEVRWRDVKSKIKCWRALSGQRCDEQLGRKALMDRVPSPLWHIINLKSKQIALCSVSVEPCVSITGWRLDHTSAVKSTPSQPVCTLVFVAGPSCLVRPAGLCGPASRLGFHTRFLKEPRRGRVLQTFTESQKATWKKRKKKNRKGKKAFQASFAAGLILINLWEVQGSWKRERSIGEEESAGQINFINFNTRLFQHCKSVQGNSLQPTVFWAFWFE